MSGEAQQFCENEPTQGECEHHYMWSSPAGSSYSVRLCMGCHSPDPEWLNALFQDWPEPEHWTADDLRTLADHMDWLADGPIAEAVVRIEHGERPVAWIIVNPHNGPTVQVAFESVDTPVPDAHSSPAQSTRDADHDPREEADKGARAGERGAEG